MWLPNAISRASSRSSSHSSRVSSSISSRSTIACYSARSSLRFPVRCRRASMLRRIAAPQARRCFVVISPPHVNMPQSHRQETGDTAYPGAVAMGRTGIGYPIPAAAGLPGTANLRTYGRTRLQRFRCAIGVSLFERFLLSGSRQVGGEIRRVRFRTQSPLQLTAVFRNVRALPDQYSLNERRPWTRHRLRPSNCLPRRFCVPRSSAACSSSGPPAIPERQPN